MARNISSLNTFELSCPHQARQHPSMSLQKRYRQINRKIRGQPKPFTRIELVGNGALSSLPAEIIQKVAKYLPSSSVAVLSLASKAIRYKLGAKYLRTEIKEPIDSCISYASPLQYLITVYWAYQRISWNHHEPPKLPELKMFLFLLARDSPSKIFCFRCGYLHSPKRSDQAQRWWPWSWKNCLTFNGSIIQMYYGRHFHFEGAQLAMQQYRRGISPKKELRRLTDHSRISELDSGSSSGLRTLRSLDARIARNRLYVRVVREAYVSDLTENVVSASIGQLYVCPHLTGRDPLSCRLVKSWVHMDFCKSPADYQCAFCRTEMQVEIKAPKRLLAKRYSIVIRVWQDFGTLYHPADLDWYSHLDTFESSTPVEFPVGGIRKAFEYA
ncbi:BgTH12-04256 [Blumeria graminis f. sp. triticale]|nr:BgTH12-04256 [Blumeria graminis f. sp. triticale]